MFGNCHTLREIQLRTGHDVVGKYSKKKIFYQDKLALRMWPPRSIWIKFNPLSSTFNKAQKIKKRVSSPRD